MTAPAVGQRGCILATLGNRFEILTPEGTTVLCSARRRLGALVCGDEIVWQTEGDSGVITEILPRRTLLQYPSAQGKVRPICANVDQLLLVLAPPFPEGDDNALPYALIDRYLVAAELSSLRAVIIMNKSDLLSTSSSLALESALRAYEVLGYSSLCLSAYRHQETFAQLAPHLRAHTSILVGPSGVGKSTLANLLAPAAHARTGTLSGHGFGKHTTTTARLYPLPDGGRLIDSPGVRRFDLWPLPPADLAWAFPEFRPYLDQCRFRDCRHLNEPACAVAQAVTTQRISASRWHSYHALLQRFATTKAAD